MTRRLVIAIVLTFGIGQATAHAHPHVWITASSELVYAPDGSLTGVRHAWAFDDMFSTYALQGIETNVESLKEFAYFTFAKVAGKKQKFDEPVDYYLEVKDNVLTLRFFLPLKAPVKSADLAVEVFDPSYFIDFSFVEKDPVKLAGAPAGCKLAFQRPNEATANAQRLSEDNFLSGDNSNYGAMFANKIAVTCP